MLGFLNDPSTLSGQIQCGQLLLAYCSWCNLPVHCALFLPVAKKFSLNKKKRKNGRRNIFMIKSPQKNVLDVGKEGGSNSG